MPPESPSVARKYRNFSAQLELKTVLKPFSSALLLLCVGCDIVQADHAPEAGVAQGFFHGVLVRHQGRHQEEVEGELEEEVERRVKREHSSNQTQVRMHG